MIPTFDSSFLAGLGEEREVASVTCVINGPHRILWTVKPGSSSRLLQMKDWTTYIHQYHGASRIHDGGVELEVYHKVINQIKPIIDFRENLSRFTKHAWDISRCGAVDYNLMKFIVNGMNEIELYDIESLLKTELKHCFTIGSLLGKILDRQREKANIAAQGQTKVAALLSAFTDEDHWSQTKAFIMSAIPRRQRDSSRDVPFLMRLFRTDETQARTAMAKLSRRNQKLMEKSGRDKPTGAKLQPVEEDRALATVLALEEHELAEIESVYGNTQDTRDVVVFKGTTFTLILRDEASYILGIDEVDKSTIDGMATVITKDAAQDADDPKDTASSYVQAGVTLLARPDADGKHLEAIISIIGGIVYLKTFGKMTDSQIITKLGRSLIERIGMFLFGAHTLNIDDLKAHDRSVGAIDITKKIPSIDTDLGSLKPGDDGDDIIDDKEDDDEDEEISIKPDPQPKPKLLVTPGGGHPVDA
jgi:hypothetical protein